MSPLDELDVLVAHIVGSIQLAHLGNVAIPDGQLLVDQRMETFVFIFDETAVAQIDHADAETLRGAVDVAELETLRTLEGSNDVVGDVAVGIGIPRSAVRWVVVAQLFNFIDHGAIDDQFQGEGKLTVLIVWILGGVLVFALELDCAMNVAVANDGKLRRTCRLHAILLLQLLDDVGRKRGNGVVAHGTRLQGELFARLQIAVGDEDGAPLRVFGILVLRIDELETAAERRNPLEGMNLADAGRIAVRILQHLVDKAHLLDFVANDEIGVLSGIATEHLLKFPTLMQCFESLERATFLLVLIRVGLVQIGPVEHVHILTVATDDVHGQRRGVVLLDDAVDDGSEGVVGVGRGRLTLVLTTDEYGHRADGKKGEFLHIVILNILIGHYRLWVCRFRRASRSLHRQDACHPT